MAKVDMKVVEEKVKNKQALTPEETKEVMSAPPGDFIVNDPEDQKEDIFKDAIDLDEPKKEDKKEEPKEEIKEPLKEEKKTVETPPAKEEEAHLDKVYKELDKPEGQEDLTAFSKNEKGLFWEMKRERRARQKAEEERDTLRFEKIKRENTPKEEVKEPVIEVADDDFVSGKQLKEILKNQKPKEAPAPSPMSGMQQRYMAMCDTVARGQYDDYDEVIEAANDILQANPDYQKQLVNAFQKGDNPALVAYHLVKGDPNFNKVLPLAKARIEARFPKKVAPKEEAKKEEKPEAKVDEAKEKEKKIEENSNKAKTSGNFGGGEGGEPGLTLQDIHDMSDAEFRKLPKAKRDAILKKYGA
jgi:hypothetical protein